MDQRPESPPAKTVAVRRPNVSRMWLYAAVAASLVGLVAVGFLFVGLLPTTSEESKPALAIEVPAGSRPLTAAFARTAGGAGEWRAYPMVVKSLAGELGREFKVRYITEEDQATEVLTKNTADLAFVCPRTYIELTRGKRYVGLVVPRIDGTTTTCFQLVTTSGSPIRTLEDLKGRKVAVSDKTSLGGWAYLQWLAQERHFDLDGYFSEIGLGETMDRNIADLKAGRIDATVVNRVQASKHGREGLRVILQSGPIPNPPVVADAELDEDTLESLRTALLAITAEDLPDGSRISGFESLDPRAFDHAAEIAAACKDEGHMK